MYWLKRCPRCRGDLVGKIGDRFYPVSCLQCGYELRADEEMRLQAPADAAAVIPIEAITSDAAAI